MFKKIFSSIFVVTFVFVFSGNHASADASAAQNQSEPKEIAKPQPSDFEEISSLKEKILDIQNKSALGFGKVIPCKSVEAYGVYSPLEAGQPGSKVVFYFEPVNYGVLKGDGRYIIDCSVDLFILDPTGKVIAGNENIRKINKISLSPILDFYLTVELNLARTLKQKAFIVKMVLNDRIKNKSVSTSQKIQLGPVPKKDGGSI